MAYFYLACAFILNAVANILLKVGSEGGIRLSDHSISALFSQNWQLILGLILFASNVIFYFLALRSLPLSIAYPIMLAMSFIIINGYALFALGESATLAQAGGYILLLAGLLLVVLGR